MHNRAGLGTGWALAALGVLGAGLTIAPATAVGQIALETTGSDTAGNRFYKVEKAAPSNTGLAKLICATPFGGKGSDTIRAVRILRDRTILVAGNRELPDAQGGGFSMGGMIFRSGRPGGSGEGTGFLMRLVVKDDKTVTPKPRVDLPGTLNSLKLDNSGRICLLLDHSAVYMIEPGASEPIKNCVQEGIRDFCTDFNGDLLVLTKEDLIRYDASWKNELWRVKVPCHGVNQGGYLTVCEKTGVATVVGSTVAHNGRGNWRGPYAHGFDREGKKIWTLWDFDPKGQLSKKDGGNDLTADTWGRSARMGRDGKVYMELLTTSEKTVLTRNATDANKPADASVFAGAFESAPGKGYATSGQAACVLFRVDPATGAVEHGTWMNAWLTAGKRANPLDMIDVTTDEQGRTCVVGRSDYGCPVKDPWYYEEDKFRGHGFLAIFDKNLQMLQCGYFHQTILTSVDAAYGYVVVGGWTLSGSSESQGMNLKVHNPIKDTLSDGESEGYLAIFSTGDHGQSEDLGPLAGGPEPGKATPTATVTPPKPPVVIPKATPAEQAAIELQLAKDLLEADKTADGMAKLEYVVTRYGDTPAGASAKALIASLAKDAAAAEAAKGGPKSTATPEDEKAADRLLQQAENYLANNMKDIARAKLQETVKKYPTTVAGKKADQMLLKVFGI